MSIDDREALPGCGIAILFFIFIGLMIYNAVTEAKPKPEAEAVKKAAEVSTVKSASGGNSDRFRVTSHGSFKAGYDNNVREIIVIEDTTTGVQYLAVTGCGTTELVRVKSGKSTVTKEE